MITRFVQAWRRGWRRQRPQWDSSDGLAHVWSDEAAKAFGQTANWYELFSLLPPKQLRESRVIMFPNIANLEPRG